MSTDVNAAELRALGRKARFATLEALRSLGGEASRQAIRERALADGGFTPRELASPVPAAAAGRATNQVEYRLEWALTNLKRDGLVDNPRRSVWRLAGAALESPRAASEETVSPERLSELRAMPYREYLRTPEWQRKRGAALHRAGYCCMIDVTHGEELEVHHNTYERLGAELESDLIVLCSDCHRLHHQRHGRPRRARPRSAVPAVASTGLPLSVRLVAEAKARQRPSLFRRLIGG